MTRTLHRADVVVGDGHDPLVLRISPELADQLGWQSTDGGGRHLSALLAVTRTSLRNEARFSEGDVLHLLDRRFDDRPYRVVAVAASEGQTSLELQQLDPADHGLEAERRFALLAAGTRDAVLVHDGTVITYCNTSAARLLGADDPAQLLGCNVYDFLDERSLRTVAEAAEVLRERRADRAQCDLEVVGLDGRPRTIEATISLVKWQGRLSVQVLAVAGADTERSSAPSPLPGDVSSDSVAIIRTDTAFTVTSWNHGAEQIYGWRSDEAVGRNIAEVVSDGHWPVGANAEAVELFAAGRWTGTATHVRRDGSPVRIRATTALLRDDDDEVVGVVSVNTLDAPDLAPIGAIDALTGLVSRAGLLEYLAHQTGTRSMMILVDLDRFGALNARRGFAAGDSVLIETARRLSSHARPGDVVARVSADRFAVVGPADQPGEVSLMAHRFADRLRDPLMIDGLLLTVSSSIGTAIGAGDLAGITLLDRAEEALRTAQRLGGRQVCAYDDIVDLDRWADDDVGAAIRAGLAAGEFWLGYQPVLDLRSRRVIRVEALARWQHPVHGEIPPSEFIRLAEQSGLIEELGQWVLSKACVEFASSRLAASIGLAINVSVVQLRRSEFVEELVGVVRHAGLQPDRVWIEVTESSLADDAAIGQLLAIHEHGFRLALDDFGTGYSSLQYVSLLPLSTVKVDRAFITGVGIDARDTAIVRSVVELARELGVEVIAEGIENAEQVDHLLTLRCHLGQGWYLGRPMSLAEVPRDDTPPTGGALPLPVDTREAERLAALHATNILDTPPEPAYDRLVELAARLLDVPMAAIVCFDHDRRFFKAQVGTTVREARGDGAFTAHLLATTGGLLIVPDTFADARLANSSLVVHPPHLRFFAGAAIRSREELIIGMLAIGDVEPRDISHEHVLILQTLAAQASALLDARRSLTALDLSPQPDVIAQRLADMLPDLVLVVDAAGDVRYANSAARLLGRSSESMVGRPLAGFVEAADLHLVDALVRDGAGRDSALALHLIGGDGVARLFEVRSSLAFEVPGINGLVLSARVVTPG